MSSTTPHSHHHHPHHQATQSIARKMAELTEEQIDPTGDLKVSQRCSQLRSEILQELREIYKDDDLSRDDVSVDSGRYDEVDDMVTLRTVGNNEKSKKEFGKRVFKDQPPAATAADIHRGRFSKKMQLPFSDSTRREQTLRASATTHERESIFTPRNALLRSGKLNMAERKPCHPVSQQPTSLPGVLPLLSGRSPRRPDQLAGPPRTVTRVTGLDRPPQFDPPANVRRPPAKLKECRIYNNNYLLEIGPRPPTHTKRLDQIYRV